MIVADGAIRGRVAVVTGASSGIGLAIAHMLGEEGHALTVAARRPDKLAGAANELRDRPAFYNALTTNCVTSIVPHARAGRAEAAPWSWKVILSGHAAQLAYANNSIDTSLPFEQLKAHSHINDAAVAAGDAPDFSTRIRLGLPRPISREATAQ